MALVMDDITLTFGGLDALQGVSFRVEPGTVFGLIGPNGAGKTCCINVLTGFTQPTSGRVLHGNSDVSRFSPKRLRQLGISRTFQAGRLFGALSVLDNVAAAFVALGETRRAAERQATEILDWIGLSSLAGRTASTLPYADQRRTAIARAMAGKPSFLLLDEPAAGMSDAEAGDLVQLIRSIPQRMGTAVLLVEHNISLVLSVCEQILVLDSGRQIEAGDAEVIRNSAAVREAYLGTSLERRAKAAAAIAAHAVTP